MLLAYFQWDWLFSPTIYFSGMQGIREVYELTSLSCAWRGGPQYTCAGGRRDHYHELGLPSLEFGVGGSWQLVWGNGSGLREWYSCSNGKGVSRGWRDAWQLSDGSGGGRWPRG